MSFLNTAIVLVLLNIVVWKSELGKKLWSNTGLANDLWFMQILAFVDIIGSLVKPVYLSKLYYRNAIEKDLKNKTELYKFNQKKVNEFFEGFDFVFEERLAKYCKTLLITFFITSLFPLVPIISVAYMIVYYWVDKSFLLRLCKVPNFCTSYIGHSMLRFFDLALIVYTVDTNLL